MSFKKYYLISIFLIFSCSEKTLFEEISKNKSGILFNNLIIENDSMNILDYEYLYNGGGAAISDFNNDGMQDIFFTGNMVNNKLYLNEGDWKFRDISIESNTEGKGKWSSGVSIIDINQDGMKDIYISCSTYEPKIKRENILYVNLGWGDDGVPKFKDMAKQYGLNDPSHNIFSSFFDYDNDGDLDVFLLINEMDKYKQPNQYRKKVVDGSSPKNDRLLRNDFNEELGHPFFTDVTLESGIKIEGYGLGVCVSDVNKDGWKDIFVSNDYLTNDLLWINNQDGTFSEKSSEYFKHTSYSSMGNNIIDFNNDGFNEILELDMMPDDNFRRKTMLTENNYNTYINNDRYKYDYQYVRNTIQQSQGFFDGKPIFSEVAMMSGISGTDWSWAPIAGDYDNDGFNDLIITNGFPKDITDRDFIDYQTQIARFTKKETLLSIIPEVKLKNYAFKNISRNDGVVLFKEVTEKWGIKNPTFSNGASHGDLDNDGDLDYVVNNIDGAASVFKNNSEELNGNNWIKIRLIGDDRNINAIGSEVILYNDGMIKYFENNPYRGYLSSMENIIHFGLSDLEIIDSIIVKWPDGNKSKIEKQETNASIEISYKSSITTFAKNSDSKSDKLFSEFNIEYKHKEYDFIDFNYQPLLYHKLSQFGPGIAVGDINGDKLDDFYIGGSRNYTGESFIQNIDGTFSKKNIFLDSTESYASEELGILFFDFDNDGDDDLYIVSGGNEYSKDHESYKDKLYLNDNGEFSLSKNILPNFNISGSCVKASDYDNDGDLDLFVCGRHTPQDYPNPTSSFILENKISDGERKFEIVNNKAAPFLNNFGMVSDAIWSDYNNDNYIDLILVGEYMPITILKNDGEVFSKVENDLNNFYGFWNSINASDFDKDGDIDYVVGNIGSNTLLDQDSKEILVNSLDFDGNKFNDFFPSAYFKDKFGKYQLYPFFTRHEFQKEVIDVRAKFILHKDFGNINYSQFLKIMNPRNDQTTEYKVNYFKSALIENIEGKMFKIKPLPDEAQISKVFGTLIKDFNDDGLDDLLLVGNDYGSEIGMGRYDASNGLVLINNGTEFDPLKPGVSGFLSDGDAKSSVYLVSQNQGVVIIGQNRGPIKAYKLNNYIQPILNLENLENYAEIYEDGEMYKKEFYYGNSFLSQSSRKVLISSKVDSVNIYRSGVLSRKFNFVSEN